MQELEQKIQELKEDQLAYKTQAELNVEKANSALNAKNK